MKLGRILPVACLLLSISSLALAQSANKGVISGRVVTEDGGNLPGLTVRLTPAGVTRFALTRTTTTDDEGNFRFTDLPPRAYSIRAEGGRAYVSAPPSAAERAQPRYLHIGDNVTLTMIRGGVITGRVTNADNQPVIALPLGVIQVRDNEGNPIAGQSVSSAVRAFTDDRGIYRFYGLTPGSYVIMANTGNPYFGSQASLYDNDAPTYYPSSTRDTAAEVQVASGAEITGIDIRFRGERGHAISGKVTGGAPQANVSLLQVNTGALIATSLVYRGGEDAGFDFYGVPDGEYELVATNDPEAIDQLQSQPRRVSVRGTDVTGIELRMLPLGSIAGRVVVETPPAACDNAPKTRLEEIVLFARLQDFKADVAFKPNPIEASANEKGEFTLNRLQPLRYRLALNLPNENLYVKSIAVKAATPAAGDLARNGVTVKQGEKLTGVTVTLAEGAASVRGKVQINPPETPLPPAVHILALPAEADAAEDMLRYAEATVHQDGTFAFTNLAPGKYLLVPTGIHVDESADRRQEFPDEKLTQLLRLRQDAAAPNIVKVEVELKACQKMTDVILKLTGARK
ncbi:MAG TPA: carboxypeptidase-like regulatory domain-containing protein [Blastocatellia bacterium]